MSLFPAELTEVTPFPGSRTTTGHLFWQARYLEKRADRGRLVEQSSKKPTTKHNQDTSMSNNTIRVSTILKDPTYPWCLHIGNPPPSFWEVLQKGLYKLQSICYWPSTCLTLNGCVPLRGTSTYIYHQDYYGRQSRNLGGRSTISNTFGMERKCSSRLILSRMSKQPLEYCPDSVASKK